MRVVILAGGLGTRMGDETLVRPKPLIETGGYPMLWHIMQIYSTFGHTEFVVALGYRGEMIKDYFLSFQARNSDLTIDLDSGHLEFRDRRHPKWKIHLIDTGGETQTGGRVKRLRFLLGDEPFLLTYGDGLARIDIHKLVAFHRAQKSIATLTAVRPPARFGALLLSEDCSRVRSFDEKPQVSAGWINGGFFVFEPAIFDYIESDQTALEHAPLERLASEGRLSAFTHEGFWQPMDTVRERQYLNGLWSSGAAPWRVWE